MIVEPLYDRVIVKRKDADESSKGGIIIPDSAKGKTVEGVVVAVGPGRINEEGKRVPISVLKGERVLIGKFIGTEVQFEYEGKEQYMVILTEDEIIGRIKYGS